MYLNPCALPLGMPCVNTKTRTPRWRTDAKVDEYQEYAGELHVGQYDPAAAAVHKKQMEYDVAHGNEEEDAYCDVGNETDSGDYTLKERLDDLEEHVSKITNHVEEVVDETVPKMDEKIGVLEERLSSLETYTEEFSHHLYRVVEKAVPGIEVRTAELEGHVTANHKSLKVAHSDIADLGTKLDKATEVERKHREALSRDVNVQIHALREQVREMMERVTVEPKKKSKWFPSMKSNAPTDYANGAFSSSLGASATARARRLHAREYELY